MIQWTPTIRRGRRLLPPSERHIQSEGDPTSMEDTILRRTWAEIDLDALAHNYRRARELTGPGVRYLGVVKADAYGHGAIQVAAQLEELGADYLAVSSLDEARELRHGGIDAPILILGHTPPEMVPLSTFIQASPWAP